MENCYSLQESDLLHEIIKAIRRNEHGLLDFVIKEILRDRDFRDLLYREIEIEKDPEEPENGMVIKIDLSREGVPDNTFRLYLSGTGTILIDWGDGTSLEVDLDTSTDDFYEHQYDINGGNKYTVKVYGQENFPGQEISFGSGDLLNNYYNRAIEEIESWGDLRLVSLSGALSYTTGPLTVPNKLPSTVTDLSYLLYESTVSEISNIQDWNTSNVTNMSSTFHGAENFDQNISSWNVSLVRDMNFMFCRAKKFNQDISEWNTSSVEDMSNMFRGATIFNKDIPKWDTSKVTDMSWMFYDAESFDGDISGWDTFSVKNMSWMFCEAKNFDKFIGGWNTSNVTDMSFMFYGAEKFDQDISEWDVSSVKNMNYMFTEASKFKQNLSGWCVRWITSKPTLFDADSGFEGEADLQPNWEDPPCS